MKPIIAIASEEIKKPSLSAFSFSWHITNEAYLQAIEIAGGIPIILPPSKEAVDIIKHVDGLLLQGGADVDPSLYKEDKHQNCGDSCISEDLFHIRLIEKAASLNKPIFGVCRGMQIINVAFGGSLYQDREENPKFNNHLMKEAYAEGVHNITIERESFLAEVFKKENLIVNSLHHQMIKDLAPGFKVAARSDDGVIEAIEKDKIRAVQWHPEAMLCVDEMMIPLFKDFISLC